MTPEDIAVLPAKLREMSIESIARLIRADWSPVNYAAKPYLDAMMSLDKITDTYGADDGRSIVAYFLSNARAWRGPVAKLVRVELQRRLKR